MKKNLALLLALAMLFGCMLGLMPAAESVVDVASSSESYKPKIAYANLNYTEDITLMFAVPAPEGLAEDLSVEVLIWEAESTSYRYKNTIATSTDPATAVALVAEDAKVTIGDVEHLVFKYKGLTPEKMTDIVYARAVVVDKDDKAVAYSDVLDYSVVEYVETAKGGFSDDGTPAIADEKVIGLLDSMLLFGATVQTFADGGDPYVPNGYYANDELHKIWVTPVVAGKKLPKVFGGFFKYEDGGYATVRAPFYDGFEITNYCDAEGNELADAYPALNDEALGFQIDAVDGDIELTVKYDSITYRIIDASEYGNDFIIQNTEDHVIHGATALANGAGGWYEWAVYMYRYNSTKSAGVQFGGNAATPGNWYSGIRTVPDPSNPDDLVFKMTSSNVLYIYNGSDMSEQGKDFFGYGDTVDEAVTFEFEVGKPNPDANVTMKGIFLVDRSDWAKWSVNDAYNGTSGTNTYALKTGLSNYILKVVDNEVMLCGNGAKICTLPDTGFMKIAATICGNGDLKVYYSTENGDMVHAGTWNAEEGMEMGKCYTDKHAQHLANLEDDNEENDDDLIPYSDFRTWLRMSVLESNLYCGPQDASPAYSVEAINAKFSEELKTATAVINGETVPVMNANGTYNPIPLQYYMEENYGYFLKQFKLSIGDPYGFEVEKADDESAFISVSGEDFGEGFAISNLTSKIGVIDGDPAKLAAMGATYDDPSKISLNAYRFEKLFRRVWFDGNISEDKFFQGFKTVEDPYHPGNLVLQVTTGNRTTLDLETIKPEALADAGWGEGGAITLEFEIGQSNPNSGVTTRVFQLSRRADENAAAGITGGAKNISIFTITDNKVYFTGNNANAETLIGEIPTTGFAKVAFVIYDTGVIKAYFSDASGNMIYACEKDVSEYSNQLGNETFANWMKYVITTRWNIGENVDAATIQAATVDIDGVPTPVYANGAYNEAALQVYMETYHSFLLESFKVSGKALYE